MHVANIIEEGKLGGPQVRICAVAKALKGSVNTTVIMPIENSDAFKQKCVLSGVPYKTFPITRITKEWRVAIRYVLFSLFEIINLAWFLKKEKFDLVHVSGGSWQFKGVIAAKLAGKKVLWHLNDTSMPKFIKYICKSLGRYVDGYIFASEASKIYYECYVNPGKMNIVIPAPVDTGKFKPYSGGMQTNNFVTIGIVANISPVKDIETFIRFAIFLNNRYRNIRFVIVGPVYKNQEGYYKKLLSLIKSANVKNVVFKGLAEDVVQVLSDVDIYICSSIAESSPISVWEAMSMEKAVVSTRVGDVPVYIKDNYNGFVVDVGDYKSMADKVSILIEDSELRKLFGVRSRKIAVEKLDIKISTQLHKMIYKQVMDVK